MRVKDDPNDHDNEKMTVVLMTMINMAITIMNNNNNNRKYAK